ncbi:hypothetical protein DENSPDRAFT_567889 [Dentipellis sp. KUC8613]|nr:hypothetical protein DENSPDRAFT_567889 [Dentipellis sp. KUC8613]
MAEGSSTVVDVQDPGDSYNVVGFELGGHRETKHLSIPPNAFSCVATELLLLIFDFAARRPDISWNAHLRWAPDVYWCPYVSTAKSLSLVCKSWHVLATEVLYRNVILNSTPQFLLLYRTLATAIGDRGRLVKSLSMTFSVSNPDVYKTIAKYLDNILQLCPRLKHLTFSQNELQLRIFTIFRYSSFEVSEIMSRVAQTLTSLRLDDGWAANSLNNAVFLQNCANVESMSILWPIHDAADAEPLPFPRLHTLTLTMDSKTIGPSYDLATFSLPALHTLTLSFVSKHIERRSHKNKPKQTILHLLSSHGNTLRRLHINFMPQLPRPLLDYQSDLWRRFKGPGTDQEFIDLCPSLEHYITYTTSQLKLSHHPSLRYIDAWVPSFSLDDTHEDPKTDFLGDSGTFPSLESFRILDVSLSVFPELPFIISPDTLIPKDQHYAIWHFGSLPVAQTRHAVTWLEHYEYNSDSDGSYVYSSPSYSSSSEEFSDSEESAAVSDAEDPQLEADPEEDVDREVERSLEIFLGVHLEGLVVDSGA